MRQAAPNRLAVGFVLSAALHALPLAFLGPQVPAAFVSSAATELMILETPAPRPLAAATPKPAGPVRTRRATSAASAATAPSAVQATADTAPAPLVIPGYRLTPGIGSAPEPGPVASVGPPPGIPDREPRLLSQLKIAYPDRASRDGLEGTVRLRISVDAQGRVTSAKVLSGPGIELNEAALAAILTARFEPATKEGEPVATSMIYLYVFTLE